MSSGQCPVRPGFTMMDPEFVADPYLQCPALMEQPVFYTPDLDEWGWFDHAITLGAPTDTAGRLHLGCG